MTLKIDKAGRIVLPKPIRDRLGLRDGGDLEVEERQDGVVLRPVERRTPLVRKGEFLVYTGKLPPNFDPQRAVNSDREERDREIWGR